MKPYIFLALIASIFIFEGLGLPNGREIAYTMIIAVPFFLVAADFQKKQIVLPRFVTKIFLGFLFFSFGSLLFSLDTVNSAKGYLLLIALFFIFIFVHNHKKELESGIFKLITTFAFIFPIYIILSRSFLFNTFPILVPDSGYQLVFPKFGLHNHIGDFLTIFFVACLYMFFKKFKYRHLVYILLFFPYFLYSFSRSAYLAFLVAGGWLTIRSLKSLQKKYVATMVAFLLFFLVSAMLFLTTSELGFFRQFAKEKLLLSDKHFFEYRNAFLSQSLASIIERPIFGVGPNNFVLTSKSYTYNIQLITYSSHNIFLDVFVEQGIFAGFIFVALILEIIKKSKRGVYFFLFLTLLIIFQFDYSFRIISLLTLFAVFAALSYETNSS